MNSQRVGIAPGGLDEHHRLLRQTQELIAAGPEPPAAMSSQTFSDVTIDLLERIAARDDVAGFAFDIDPDRRTGKACGATPFGEVEIRFDLFPERAGMTVTVLRKPPFVPAALLWSEFSRAIEHARTDSRR